MDISPVVVEQTFDSTIADVWEAITNKDKMKQWYFDVAEFKAEVGFEFSFMGENEGRKFKHLCRITEVVPEKRLVHTWQYEGYPGLSTVTFELFDQGGKTRVKLTHEGIETFPVTEHKDFAKENFMGGWTYIMGTSLVRYLSPALSKGEGEVK
jgi:uncharacterized protein YndB with AHSA1/START domain